MPWSRKSRHERGYGTTWDKLRERILVRDKHLCQPCLEKGRPTPAYAVDHKVAKSRGGTDSPENLQAICRDCHKDKTIEEAGGRVKPVIGLDGWPIGR